MAFKINVNTENTGDKGFTIVAEGKYEATIVRAKLEEFGGNHNIGFDVEIRSDVQQQHAGAKVLYNTLYLTSNNPEYAESTQQKVNAFFAALGCQGGEIDVEEELKKAIGKNIVAYVKHETKGDKVYPKVKFVGKSKDLELSPQQTQQQSNGLIEVFEDELPF